MSQMGVLFVPSGPGLNSAPAREFLAPIFERTGRTVFWNEPSSFRGNPPPPGDLPAWENLVASLAASARSFTSPFVVVTESFGSLLAEALYRELAMTGDANRIAGFLHTPPTIDLLHVFRRSLEMGQDDFAELGDAPRLERMKRLLAELERDPRIDSPALLEGVVLAFESPKIMTHYFRTQDSLMRWAGAFGTPESAPEPAMRDRILRGMGAANAPLRTTFAPDVPTFVCAGDHDPYEPLSVFAGLVETARKSPGRRSEIVWHPMRESGHYPYADQPEQWESEVWRPFLSLVEGR